MMNPILSLAAQGIDHNFHEPFASLMKGLVYGIPVSVDPTLKQQIVKSGLAHLVVLSGANVTLLAQFSERICFLFSKRVGILLQLIFLCGFVLLVGPQAPLIRAVCMFFCTAICVVSGRPSHMGWNLFLTVFFISIIRPAWVGSLSFQLSVMATIGIMVWGGVSSRLPTKTHPLAAVFFESWVVFLTTIPLTVWYFRSLSLMSPFSTALVSWLIVPLMVAGFAVSLLHLLFPPVATLVAIPTQMGLQFVISVIQWTSRVPFGYIIL